MVTAVPCLGRDQGRKGAPCFENRENSKPAFVTVVMRLYNKYYNHLNFLKNYFPSAIVVSLVFPQYNAKVHYMNTQGRKCAYSLVGTFCPH